MRRLLATVFPLVLLSEFGDGLNGVCGGAARCPIYAAWQFQRMVHHGPRSADRPLSPCPCMQLPERPARPGSVALIRGAAVPGIMRGAGRQLLATISNAIVYWAGCCPLAVFLAPRLGVPGLWLALAAATSLQVLAPFVCLVRMLSIWACLAFRWRCPCPWALDRAFDILLLFWHVSHMCIH